MRTLIFICLFFVGFNLVAQKSDRNDMSFFVQQVNFDLYQKNKEVENRELQIDGQENALITQIGYKNVLSITGDINDYQTIEQRGDKNYYNFTDYYNSRTSKMQVLQEGESNSLQIIGTNSFSDNIIIRQKSNYKSIIVRNF